MSTSEADELAQKLERYVLNLRQVEAALEHEPTNVELLKLKADLNELIDLTRKLLADKISAGATLTKHLQGDQTSVMYTSVYPSTSSSYHSSNPSTSRSSSSTMHPDLMLKSIKALEDSVYRDFIIQAFDPERPIEVIRCVSKFYNNKGKKVVARRIKKMNQMKNGHDESDDEVENGDANLSNGLADSGALSGVKRDHQFSRSAWKASLIFRGDMINTDDLLFIVVKKIRLKPTIFRDHKIAAGVVCLVNLNKYLVFWAKVKWPEDEICQTFPNLTGITLDKLENGLPLEQVSGLLKCALKGNVLIGFNVEEDLLSLDMNHDQKINLGEYFRDEEGPFQCEDAKFVLEACGGECGPNRILHESRTLPGLYIWMKTNEREHPTFTTHPMAKIVQSMKKEGSLKFKPDPGDTCHCPL